MVARLVDVPDVDDLRGQHQPHRRGEEEQHGQILPGLGEEAGEKGRRTGPRGHGLPPLLRRERIPAAVRDGEGLPGAEEQEAEEGRPEEGLVAPEDPELPEGRPGVDESDAPGDVLEGGQEGRGQDLGEPREADPADRRGQEGPAEDPERVLALPGGRRGRTRRERLGGLPLPREGGLLPPGPRNPPEEPIVPVQETPQEDRAPGEGQVDRIVPGVGHQEDRQKRRQKEELGPPKGRGDPPDRRRESRPGEGDPPVQPLRPLGKAAGIRSATGPVGGKNGLRGVPLAVPPLRLGDGTLPTPPDQQDRHQGHPGQDVRDVRDVAVQVRHDEGVGGELVDRLVVVVRVVTDEAGRVGIPVGLDLAPVDPHLLAQGKQMGVEEAVQVSPHGDQGPRDHPGEEGRPEPPRGPGQQGGRDRQGELEGQREEVGQHQVVAHLGGREGQPGEPARQVVAEVVVVDRGARVPHVDGGHPDGPGGRVLEAEVHELLQSADGGVAGADEGPPQEQEEEEGLLPQHDPAPPREGPPVALPPEERCASSDQEEDQPPLGRPGVGDQVERGEKPLKVSQEEQGEHPGEGPAPVEEGAEDPGDEGIDRGPQEGRRRLPGDQVQEIGAADEQAQQPDRPAAGVEEPGDVVHGSILPISSAAVRPARSA